VALAALGACKLLPERFSVNGPIAQVLWGQQIEPPEASRLGEILRVPAGFEIGLFATEVPNARMMRFTRRGDLAVSLPRDGSVALLEADRDGDGRSDGRRLLITGLRLPHGIDFHEHWLYIAETDAVGRIAFDANAGEVVGEYQRIVDSLPGGGNHWSRTLRFGPDGWMYVSVGSSCNACEEADPRRAAMLRFRPDGSGEEIFATGLRNTVGFDWRPEDGELYGTDNGRDLLGDDFPPCELNRIDPGGFYGWPYANGGRVPDPNLGAGRAREIAVSATPVFDFPAHNAPLGITFLGSRAPSALRGSALVALHGSWNRSTKDGYKVVSLHWSPSGSIESRDFVVGFERDEQVVGRPVDTAIGPDGAIYISDDYASAIYRVRAIR
jgi:glucose/arabinose dehydrogenase